MVFGTHSEVVAFQKVTKGKQVNCLAAGAVGRAAVISRLFWPRTDVWDGILKESWIGVITRRQRWHSTIQIQTAPGTGLVALPCHHTHAHTHNDCVPTLCALHTAPLA
jgi:hypothetical protein